MTMEQRMDRLEKRNKRLTVALTLMAESCSITWRPFSRARAPASIRSHFMLSENCGPIWSAAFYPTAFFGCVALTATKVGPWPFRARAAAFAPVAWLDA